MPFVQSTCLTKMRDWEVPKLQLPLNFVWETALNPTAPNTTETSIFHCIVKLFCRHIYIYIYTYISNILIIYIYMQPFCSQEAEIQRQTRAGGTASSSQDLKDQRQIYKPIETIFTAKCTRVVDQLIKPYHNLLILKPFKPIQLSTFTIIWTTSI